MRVVPVLDLRSGVVVRGVRGERHRYRPVSSVLTGSVEPLDVARALADVCGHRRLYVADLDAIAGAEPALELLERLVDAGFEPLVDVGLRDVPEALALAARGAVDVIAALETLPAPETLREIVDSLGGRRVVFSLDLLEGRPVAASASWPSELDALCDLAVDGGVGGLLLLDLAAVGSGEGPRHLDRLARWRERAPALRLLGGGGVRTVEDLESVASVGVDEVLVASALHDGSIGAADLARFAP